MTEIQIILSYMFKWIIEKILELFLRYNFNMEFKVLTMNYFKL